MANQDKNNSKVFSVQDIGQTFCWGNAPELGVDSTDQVFKWVDVVRIKDVPADKYVLDGIKSGLGTGTLGAINENDLDIASQLETKVYDLIEFYIDNKYQKLDYMTNLDLNDFYSNAYRYGVLVEGDFQDLEETSFSRDVVELDFEVILTSDWIDNADDDLGARDAAKELKKEMELIRRKVRKTRAGTYNSGNIQSPITWTTDAPEYEEDNKLVILRAYFTIKYSVKK